MKQSEESFISKKKGMISTFKDQIGRLIFASLLITVYYPVSVATTLVQRSIKLPFMPMIWMIKLVYPNINEDISLKSTQLKTTVKNTADKSFMTMSSLIAK